MNWRRLSYECEIRQQCLGRQIWANLSGYSDCVPVFMLGGIATVIDLNIRPGVGGQWPRGDETKTSSTVDHK